MMMMMTIVTNDNYDAGD